MIDDLSVYIPQDRRDALARGATLPTHTHGAALFADISGFTPLTDKLNKLYGARRSVEELTRHINAVYEMLIAEINRYGGSVISFAGDGMMCWFDEARATASPRAVACALAMQKAIQNYAECLATEDDIFALLAIKSAIASGPARRFVVGDPSIQYIDALAGKTIDRTATAEQLAKRNEVLIDQATEDALASQIEIAEWRVDESTHDKFAVVRALQTQVAPAPWDTPASMLDQVQAWLIKIIYTRSAAGQSEFLTELRPVVALFVRFEGIDYDDDENAGEKLDQLIRRFQQVVQHYEGTLIDLNIGDKGSYVYAAFGALHVHEDDTMRAVNAAMAMRLIPAELNFVHPLQIGISQGTMRTGAYGSTTRRNYGALGNEVNIAARLMARANPGELLISARIQQTVAEYFDLEPLPPLELKGKPEPLLPFLVKGYSADRNVRLQEPHHALPMIGRARELHLIEEKLAAAIQGKGQIIAVTAEAGMGKSRLIEEAIRLAKRRGVRGYGGACQSYATNTSYFVWSPIWRAFFDVDDTAPLRKQLRYLENEIQDLAPERVQAIPLLNTLIQISIPENEFTQNLQPQYRKSSLEALLLECVHTSAKELGAEGKALLFVLEDLHWIDPVSFDLLYALAQAIADLPVLIVLAYRSRDPRMDERMESIQALPYCANIALNELGIAEAESLIRAKLAQFAPERIQAIPHALIDQITQHAEGNPFYVEEFLNYLRDRGLDPFDANSLATLELPTSLHRLILSRIDQLNENQSLTLKVASIIGRQFKFAHLHGYYPALGKSEIVKKTLDELEQLDLTPAAPRESELTYLFKHIVTHQVAYASLGHSTRAALHEQYAWFLENQIAANAAPALSLLDALAYHYDQSDNLEKKCEYLRRAGQAAQSAYANAAALDYYERLLRLLIDPGAQIEIRLKIGAIDELIGHWNDAETQYRAALEQAERAHDQIARAQCRVALGVLCRQRGEYDLALRWLEQAKTDWTTLNQRAGYCQTLSEIGGVFLRQGNYQAAKENLESSLELARSLNDKPSMAMALQQLGVVSHQSDYAAARSLYEASLALYRELGNKLGISNTLSQLAVVVAEQGEFEVARALYEESLELRRELGDKRGIAISLNNLGALFEDQGDLERARGFYVESLALRRELGEKPGIATGLSNLGVIAVLQNDWASARQFYAESMLMWRETGDRRGIGYCALCQGFLARHEGDLARAQILCRQGLAEFQVTQEKRYIANCLAALVVISVEQNANREQWIDAMRIAGATDSLIESLKTHLERQFDTPFQQALARLRGVIDSETFEGEWTIGKTMKIDDAIALALQEAR